MYIVPNSLGPQDLQPIVFNTRGCAHVDRLAEVSSSVPD